jgi:hypothetical protein
MRSLIRREHVQVPGWTCTSASSTSTPICRDGIPTDADQEAVDEVAVAVRGAGVPLDDDELVAEHRQAGSTGERNRRAPQPLGEIIAEALVRDEEQPGRVVDVEEAQAGGVVADQLARAGRDRLEDLGLRRAGIRVGSDSSGQIILHLEVGSSSNSKR